MPAKWALDFMFEWIMFTCGYHCGRRALAFVGALDQALAVSTQD
jgi:hypothetical protein